MKSVKLSANGMNFSTTFSTIVTKVVNPEADSKIVLDSIPHVEISLGSETAKSLGIEKDSKVTIKPGTDGFFTLEVGEKEKKTTKQSTRGSSPLPGSSFSNRLD